MDGRIKKYLPIENLEARQDCLICSLQKAIGRFVERRFSVLGRSDQGTADPVKPRRGGDQ